jgi:hypothetical protein
MDNEAFGPPTGRHAATARQVVASLPGMYLLLSPQLAVEAVSNAYLQQTGSDVGQGVGRYVWDVLAGEKKDTPSTLRTR